jgi:hypothetical protein
LGFIVAGVIVTHKIQLGVQVPFTFERLARGLTTLYEATLGLPYDLPLWLGVGVAIILTGLALWFVAPERGILPLACLLLPPALAILVTLHVARGDYQKVVARMESAGPASYGSNMAAEVGRTVLFYDARFGGKLTQVTDWCRAPPEWFILSDDPAHEAARRSFGPPQCAAPYVIDMVMVPAPLSGLRFALYRHTN